MNTIELLTKARKVIENESAWTQGQFARKANGNPVHAVSPHAICYCALGALQAAIGSDNLSSEEETALDEGTDLLRHVAESFGYVNIVDLNDSSNHETVLEAYDEAIKLTKEQGYV